MSQRAKLLQLASEIPALLEYPTAFQSAPAKSSGKVLYSPEVTEKVGAIMEQVLEVSLLCELPPKQTISNFDIPKLFEVASGAIEVDDGNLALAIVSLGLRLNLFESSIVGFDAFSEKYKSIII